MGKHNISKAAITKLFSSNLCSSSRMLFKKYSNSENPRNTLLLCVPSWCKFTLKDKHTVVQKWRNILLQHSHKCLACMQKFYNVSQRNQSRRQARAYAFIKGNHQIPLKITSELHKFDNIFISIDSNHEHPLFFTIDFTFSQIEPKLTELLPFRHRENGITESRIMCDSGKSR